MPVKYCSNCGSKVTFELQAPEKCPKCGKSINAALKTVASTVQNIQSQQIKQYTTQRIKSTELQESDEIDYDLVDQIKANLSQSLRGLQITVDNIPEFRVPLGNIIQEQK